MPHRLLSVRKLCTYPGTHYIMWSNKTCRGSHRGNRKRSRRSRWGRAGLPLPRASTKRRVPLVNNSRNFGSILEPKYQESDSSMIHVHPSLPNSTCIKIVLLFVFLVFKMVLVVVHDFWWLFLLFTVVSSSWPLTKPRLLAFER